MKQLFLFAVAMFVATASFAQEKGDMCISGTISLELGSQTTTVLRVVTPYLQVSH